MNIGRNEIKLLFNEVNFLEKGFLEKGFLVIGLL